MPDQPDDSSRYLLDATGTAKEKIKQLAKETENLSDLEKDLREIVEYLETDPLTWAGLGLPTGGANLIECHKYFKKYTIHYLVNDQRKDVILLDVDIIGLG